MVNTLAELGIEAHPRADAPGVYVGEKICSLGLRIRRGCSFHGLALNVNMDLSPFLRINPCGYAGMEMAKNITVNPEATTNIAPRLLENILALLKNPDFEYITRQLHTSTAQFTLGHYSIMLYISFVFVYFLYHLQKCGARLAP